MALAASSLAEEEGRAPPRLRRQSLLLASQVTIPGAIQVGEDAHLVCGDSVGRVLEAQPFMGDLRVSVGKESSVFRDGQEAIHDGIPDPGRIAI